MKNLDYNYMIAVIIMILIICFVGGFILNQTMSEGDLNKLMQQRTFELQSYQK